MEWMPPIYILCNRTYEKDRYTALCAHLEKRGIPMDRIIWVDSPWGSEISSEQYFSLYTPFKGITFKSTGLLRGEVSLNLAFYKAITMALETDASFILVFESDIVLREDFIERLKKIVEDLCDGPKWDYCSLGEGVGTRPEGREASSYYDETQLYKHAGFGGFRCTDSMLLHRNFLEKVKKTLFPCRDCLDWEMNIQAYIHNAIVLWADPPIVEPGSGRWRNLSQLPS
jgi:GR25 family glycosyltransferase involved in LPS biosynthesis